MIKQKIIALVGSALLTVGLMGPVAYTPAVAQTANDASIIIRFCKTAHNRFVIKNDGGAYLRQGMEQLPAESRPVVALACAAYGEGYSTGTRSLV